MFRLCCAVLSPSSFSISLSIIWSKAGNLQTKWDVYTWVNTKQNSTSLHILKDSFASGLLRDIWLKHFLNSERNDDNNNYDKMYTPTLLRIAMYSGA